MRWWRYLWASPTTMAGLALVPFAVRGGQVSIVDGVVEAHGPALAWMLSRLVPIAGGAAAVTLGHVVVGRSARALAACRGHERVHVRQCERWGPFFVPAYLVAGVWAAARGRHPYLDNRFEREARVAGAGAGIRGATARPQALDRRPAEEER